MSGNGSTDTIYGQLDEASKQQIISDLAKDNSEVMGMVIYSFAAENADGYTVEITSARLLVG